MFIRTSRVFVSQADLQKIFVWQTDLDQTFARQVLSVYDHMYMFILFIFVEGRP